MHRPKNGLNRERSVSTKELRINIENARNLTETLQCGQTQLCYN